MLACVAVVTSPSSVLALICPGCHGCGDGDGGGELGHSHDVTRSGNSEQYRINLTKIHGLVEYY